MTIFKVFHARLLLVLMFLTTLIACAVTTTHSNSIKINRLVFLNHSSLNLSNVRIFVSKTNELASCGYILPNTECSTGFRLREYQGNKFDVSWIENGTKKIIKNIVVHVADNIPTEKPLHMVIIFGKQGQLTATLQTNNLNK